MTPLGELDADVTGTDDGRSPVVLLHGLTFDREMWGPLVQALDGRRALALDLPGHGGSPRRNSYDLGEVADLVHGAVAAAGLRPPVLVGHSIGAVLSTVYAARHPARAVVNLDQIMLPGPFGGLVRAAEPELRGPGWRAVWDRMVAGMGIDTLQGEARHIAETITDPRPDLLLGYWAEILQGTDQEIRADREADLRSISRRGIGYHWVTAAEPPAPYVAWMTSLLPDAVITLLPGSHLPHLEHPAAIAELLSR